MTRPPPSVRVLHAVRLLGFADTAAVADRAGTGHHEAAQILQQASDRGWVQHATFADLGGWSLTEQGRAENEQQLALERERADPGGVVAAAYREFLPLNARLLRACTDWQMRPSAEDTFAPNDHTDTVWDARVLGELTAIGEALERLVGRLTAVLARFGGYDTRFRAALRRVWDGENDWVDSTSVDSCHRVWFQLHEDLLATLGVDRADEAAGDPR